MKIQIKKVLDNVLVSDTTLSKMTLSITTFTITAIIKKTPSLIKLSKMRHSAGLFTDILMLIDTLLSAITQNDITGMIEPRDSQRIWNESSWPSANSVVIQRVSLMLSDSVSLSLLSLYSMSLRRPCHLHCDPRSSKNPEKKTILFFLFWLWHRNENTFFNFCS
jgi:hypothetical protein